MNDAKEKEELLNLKRRKDFMGTRRQVESGMCIFSLTIGKVISLPESIRVKVMMLYSRQENRREFRILENVFPGEIKQRIISWLEGNTEADDIFWELNANRMDADRFHTSRLCLESCARSDHLRLACAGAGATRAN
jgi:hypothetical protein